MKTKSVIKKSPLVPTVLIAGGAGFVGSHLCEALLAKQARVIVLDNFSSGKQSYVNHLLTDPKFALFDCDINSNLPDSIESVDYIFHIAGLEEYSYSKDVMDLSSLLTNAFGTKNLLDLAKKSQAKFLLLSTIDVYEGRMSQLGISEYFGRNKIEESRYMMAEAKRYAEALVWEYYKKNEIDCRIVRVPEIYGARMSLMSSGNLGRFLSDVMSGRDLTVFGEGNEKEFYLYIDDAINGILKTMYSERTKGNIYSLVGEEPLSVLELAYMIKAVADRDVRVKFEEAPTEGYFKPGFLKMPDTFNLEEIKWAPKTFLKDGIIETFKFFNYSPNTHSFKPAKLIEQKNEAKVAAEAEAENLFTLSDVKIPPKFIAPKIVEANNNGVNFVTTQKTFEFPKIVLPKLNVGLPKVSFPKLPSAFSKAFLIVAIFFVAAAIFIGIPLFGVYINTKQAVNDLRQAQTMSAQINSAQVMSESKAAYDSLYRAKNSLAWLQTPFNLIGKNNTYQSYNKLLGSLAYFSKAIYTGAKATKPLENLWEVIRPDTSSQIDAAQFDDAKDQLYAAKNSLLLAQADFKYVDPKELFSKHRVYYDEYKRILNSAGQVIDDAAPVFSSAPNLLGSTGPKKYLILLQNSNELRATGGFIGSYGLLTLDKGKIKDLVIDDVYNPDGQIDQRNILSTVPKPISDFLKETKLHIRNANWDPDFTASANTIEDLYFKVTGEKLDGVVAVDLFFIKNLLNVTGPLFLTAYNEEVSSGNVYERTELHSEFNYQDGSDQKRSFLTVLGSKLLEKIFSLNRENLPSLTSAVAASLNERHLMVYFTNDPLNDLLKTNHWDGSLISSTGDYLYIVDSNLGGTKANYYVKENADYTVSAVTRDGVLRASLKITYNHLGKDSAWPSGPYTDYVRVLSQRGAKLTGATIQTDSLQSTDIFKNVMSGTQGKYSTFETSFVLQPQSKLVLTLNYDLAPQLDLTKDQRVYSLYWQKQPGTEANGFTFLMPLPFGFKVLEKSANLNQNSDSLSLHDNLNVDKNLYVKLQ